MSNRTNTEKNMRAMDLWMSEAPKQLKESDNKIIDVGTGNEYASEKINPYTPIILRCNICGKTGDYTCISSHIHQAHKDARGGRGGKFEYVNKSYHHCKLCSHKLLFAPLFVRKYLR